MVAPPTRARPEARDAVRDLLRDSRGLRREQQQARDAWYNGLTLDRKDDLLFELEILLKGAACFANPRNHSGPPRRAPVVVQDYREQLLLLRDSFARIAQLSRVLLGEQDRVFVFQRYLETVLPEDNARTRLVRAGMTQTTPEEALFVLRHGMTNLIEVADGLLRLQRVPFRLFYALAGTTQREIGNNTYFNPLSALEFRQEFDRITSKQVLELIAAVPGDAAHRFVALTFLSLFRMLKYLRLVENIAREHGDGRRQPGRMFLVLSVLRSDARALANYLRQNAGNLLATAYEDTLLRVPARELREQHDNLRAQGHRLIAIRAALEGVAATLRLEMRRTYENDLPAPEMGTPFDDLKGRMLMAVFALRPTLQNAIMFLARSLGAKLDENGVFDEKEARRISSDRLRRDVWIFAQILRAFALKARHADPGDDRWAGAASFQFVKEFLSYFQSMGYPLLRVSDYPRFDAFMAAMSQLEDTDLVDPVKLEHAVVEAEAFQEFLKELFESISRREELAEVPFDKRAAATALKLYLGRSLRRAFEYRHRISNIAFDFDFDFENWNDWERNVYFDNRQSTSTSTSNRINLGRIVATYGWERIVWRIVGTDCGDVTLGTYRVAHRRDVWPYVPTRVYARMRMLPRWDVTDRWHIMAIHTHGFYGDSRIVFGRTASISPIRASNIAVPSRSLSKSMSMSTVGIRIAS